MKKNLIKLGFMGLLLMTGVNANAQIDLSNIGKVLEQVASGSEGLSSLLSSNNNVTAKTIAGTWTYNQPAIIFESSNLLKKAGGSIASATFENKIATQLQKAGIKAGLFKITFNEDGTFTTYKNGKKATSGNYTINGSKITLAYLKGGKGVTGYAQLSSNKLSLTFDSSKLLTAMSSLSKISASSSLKTLSSLAGSFDGMKAGLEFSK